MKTHFVRLITLGAFLFNSAIAFAVSGNSPQTFTLDGQLYQPASTTPLLDSGAKITVQILNPAKTCILYEEQQTVDTTATNGYFNIQVGSNIGAVKRTASDPGRSMSEVFQNSKAVAANSVPGQTCALSSYSPSSGDKRYFRLTITPSATNVAGTLSPDMILDSVPNALVAQSVQGLERDSILQVNSSGSTSLTQANLESMFTSANYTNLQSVMSGNFVQTGTNGASLPSFAANPTTPPQGSIWYDSVTHQVKYQSNSGAQVIGASGTAGSLNVGTTANNVVQLDGSAKLPAVDGSALTNLTADNISSGTLSASRLPASVALNGGNSVSATMSLGTTSANDLALKTNNTTKMTILSSGNVGLGVTSPSSDLSFDGNAARTIAMERHSTADTAGNNLNLVAGSATSGATDKNGGTLYVSGGTATGTGTSKIEFQTATAGTTSAIDRTPTTKMTILGNGNVGIGTTSPGSRLHLHSGSTSNTTIFLQTLNSWAAGITQTDTSLMKFNNGGADRMVIDSTGNVGLGTTSPNTKLDIRGGGAKVQSATQFDGVVVHNGTNNVAVIQGISASNDNGILGLSNSGTLGVYFTASGTSYVNGGNVGIGTTNPTRALEVAGSVPPAATINGAALLKITNSDTTGTFGSPSVVGIAFAQSGSNMRQAIMGGEWGNDFLDFYVNGDFTTPKVRIDSTGNVGIGTTSPQATLDVNGYARLKKNSAQPVACSATNDGAIALTSQYTLCTCKGGSTAWVKISDGTTACAW